MTLLDVTQINARHDLLPEVLPTPREPVLKTLPIPVW